MPFKRNSPGGCTSCTCGGTITCVCPGAPATINIACTPGSGAGDYCRDVDLFFLGTPTTPFWYSSGDVRSASCDGLVVGGNAYGYHRIICVGGTQMRLDFLARSGPCPLPDHNCSYPATLALCTWTMTTPPNACVPFTMASGVRGAFSPTGTVWTGSG